MHAVEGDMLYSCTNTMVRPLIIPSRYIEIFHLEPIIPVDCIMEFNSSTPCLTSSLKLKVPYFNAGAYVEGKSKIGKVITK